MDLGGSQTPAEAKASARRTAARAKSVSDRILGESAHVLPRFLDTRCDSSSAGTTFGRRPVGARREFALAVAFWACVHHAPAPASRRKPMTLAASASCTRRRLALLRRSLQFPLARAVQFRLPARSSARRRNSPPPPPPRRRSGGGRRLRATGSAAPGRPIRVGAAGVQAGEALLQLHRSRAPPRRPARRRAACRSGSRTGSRRGRTRRPARRSGRWPRRPAPAACKRGRAEHRPRLRLGAARVGAAGRGSSCPAVVRSLPGPTASGVPAFAEDLGESPVHDLDLAEGTDHDVGRLQVAVDDAAAVGVGDRLADLLERAGSRSDPSRPRALDEFRQRPALDELHGQERPAVLQPARPRRPRGCRGAATAR